MNTGPNALLPQINAAFDKGALDPNFNVMQQDKRTATSSLAQEYIKGGMDPAKAQARAASMTTGMIDRAIFAGQEPDDHD